MKKILYFVDKESHFKVFWSFLSLDDDSQYVLIPDNFKGIFGSRNIIKYKNIGHAKQIISDVNPGVFVQSRNKGVLHEYLDAAGIKKVLVGHGIFTNNDAVGVLLKNARHIYKRYDLICVATEKYDRAPLLKNARLDKNVVCTTGLSQFDSLYNIIKNNDFADNDSEYDKTILFIGGKALNRIPNKKKYVPRKEFYRYITDLAAICNNNNWQLLIKPRTNDFKFLRNNIKTMPWTKHYVNLYNNLLKNKNIKLLDHDCNIYEYFNSDVIVLDGWSTAEMEICLANIPMIIIDEKKSGDYFGVASSGAASLVDDPKFFYDSILSAMDEKNISNMFKNQKEIISNSGIIFDGKSYKRIVQKINLLI